jgi:hypothetical protein
VEQEAHFWMQLRNDPVLIVGPLHLSCRHHDAGPTRNYRTNGAGSLKVPSLNCEAQLPAARGATDAPCVDADHKAAGSHVLVAEHRPAIGCLFVDLRDLT